MNLYQKVLVKLYEDSDGRDTKTVDLKELVKGMGFLGNYPDIFQQMSGQGWIAETRRADNVRITHWGIKEAKKVGIGDDGISAQEQLVIKEVEAVKSDITQFSIMVNDFSEDQSSENFKSLENIFNRLKNSIDKIKKNI